MESEYDAGEQHKKKGDRRHRRKSSLNFKHVKGAFSGPAHFQPVAPSPAPCSQPRLLRLRPAPPLVLVTPAPPLCNATAGHRMALVSARAQGLPLKTAAGAEAEAEEAGSKRAVTSLARAAGLRDAKGVRLLVACVVLEQSLLCGFVRPTSWRRSSRNASKTGSRNLSSWSASDCSAMRRSSESAEPEGLGRDDVGQVGMMPEMDVAGASVLWLLSWSLDT